MPYISPFVRPSALLFPFEVMIRTCRHDGTGIMGELRGCAQGRKPRTNQKQRIPAALSSLTLGKANSSTLDTIGWLVLNTKGFKMMSSTLNRE